MTRRHDEIFRDVLGGLGPAGPGPAAEAQPAPPDPEADRGATRFLRRGRVLAEVASGERVEKTLLLVDPARCKMWAGHNRRYDLLTDANCAELIEGIRAQGGQEFPAVVRRVGGGSHDWEVICGARRHFAVTWLRAHSYPQLRFLVEERELTDEEAFRLADIENRDREDLSDWERARDYARALAAYYGGRQKAMAERLEVSPAWLSRWLDLARLPEAVVAAYPAVTDLREAHARALKPALADPATRGAVLARAEALAEARRAGEKPLDGAATLRALLAASRPPKAVRAGRARVFRGAGHREGITLRRRGRTLTAEFPADIGREALAAAFAELLGAEFPG